MYLYFIISITSRASWAEANSLKSTLARACVKSSVNNSVDDEEEIKKEQIGDHDSYGGTIVCVCALPDTVTDSVV